MGEPAYTVMIDPASVDPGAEIAVSWVTPEGAGFATDYVALIPVGGLLTQKIWSTSTMGIQEHAARWHAPNVFGAYQAVYVKDNGDVVVAESNVLTVEGPVQPDYLVTAMSEVAVGGSIIFDWAVKEGILTSMFDWIGLYRAGTPNEEPNFLAWMYTEGAQTGTNYFTADFGEGIFEIRYLLDDGFESVASSGPITVS